MTAKQRLEKLRKYIMKVKKKDLPKPPPSPFDPTDLYEDIQEDFDAIFEIKDDKIVCEGKFMSEAERSFLAKTLQDLNFPFQKQTWR